MSSLRLLGRRAAGFGRRLWSSGGRPTILPQVSATSGMAGARPIAMRSTVAAAGLFCTIAGDASASPIMNGRTEGDAIEVLAPRGAFEIAVNGAYTQPWGEL